MHFTYPLRKYNYPYVAKPNFMTENLPIPIPQTNRPPVQASSDDQLIQLWLHGRSSKHTQTAYKYEIDRMRQFIMKPLQEITLQDLQDFSDHLQDKGLKQTSINRALASIKSLFSFGHKLGFFVFDVARPLRIQSTRDELPERILSEDQIRKMITHEKNPRNKAILTLLYSSGIRVSELTGLKWKNVQERSSEAGQMVVHGKGGKTRTILLPEGVWIQLNSLRLEDDDNLPVFVSKRGGHLHASQVWRIVKAAAKKVGINQNVFPHILRHCHASHALDANAPISLVQKTLGHTSISTTGKYLHARPNESSSQYINLEESNE